MPSNELIRYSGPASVKKAPTGRTFEYEWEEEHKRAWIPFPVQYQRKYKPMLHPTQDRIMSDDEIDSLINMTNRGWHASRFASTEDFIEKMKMRDAVFTNEKVYGMTETDVTVVRFFDHSAAGPDAAKRDNILADIRALNEKQGMGNVKIPGTSIEIINYSPCPKCGEIHSFADVFAYYSNPVPDPEHFSSRSEQYQRDTRVRCKACQSYFFPALVVVDGDPTNECQMICRSQTIREVTVFMRQEVKQEVLWMKDENILEDVVDGRKLRAWRNDVDASILKRRPALLTNMLSYTPSTLMLDFLSRKNLEEKQPLYDAWMPETAIQRAYRSNEI